jgi:hypothetical protein
MSEFKPKEGDRILVGNTEPLVSERIFLYIDRHGRYMCVHANDEKIYNGNQIGSFRVIHWLLAKPLTPKQKLPEFIDGDPVIVWGPDGKEHIRIVYDVIENGSVRCYPEGESQLEHTDFIRITWSNYKPLQNYYYGNSRRVWGSEDKH